MHCCSFKYARPIWIKGREKEMNVTAGFRCKFEVKQGAEYSLALTGSTLYRVLVNGKFVHYGPVRAPHGFARIDLLDLTPWLSAGLNELFIEAAGYNCSSYYTLNRPSFIQAELMENGSVTEYTSAEGGFEVFKLNHRVQKVARYSYQRAFTEVYLMDNANTTVDFDDINTPLNLGGLSSTNKVEASIADHGLTFLPREVPIPVYNLRYPERVVETGTAGVVADDKVKNSRKYRFIHNIPGYFTAFSLEEIKERPFDTVGNYEFSGMASDIVISNGGLLHKPIGNGGYVLLDMGLNNNGFILSTVTAEEDSEVYFLFDEKLIDGKIDLASLDSINIVKYSLKKSDRAYNLETMETYGFKYILCFVEKGSIILNRLALREYSYPVYSNAELRSGDKKLDAIFKAAIETYRQNTLDVFMDCPTRERAGWLCDSYFTAQSSRYFSGDGIVEKVMLDNYLLAGSLPEMPVGMLPMCYPAEHPDSNFIPQWAMWYVIQLDGYFKRYGNIDKEKYRKLCYDLLKYLGNFRNSDGLLEKLSGWNFIEWSEANNWVQDVHYPTNMLYSKVLLLIGTWYGDPELLNESDKVGKLVIAQSFDGTYFIDNAIRLENGQLSLTENRSEVCQYFAYFSGIIKAEDEKFDELKDIILNKFGPERKKKKLLPEIAFANAFIGNYIRMELLVDWGRYRQAVEESRLYFYRMAETTGTLWENDDITGSLNHGFASYIGVVLIRCAAGIKNINGADGSIELDFKDTGLENVEARVGTSHGDIIVSRKVIDGKVELQYSVPEGVKVKLTGVC